MKNKRYLSLDSPKVTMDSLEQIEREYKAWKPANLEEEEEFWRIAEKVTGVLKFPVERPLNQTFTPADNEYWKAFVLLIFGAWKAHQANALRLAEDREAGRERTYGPLFKEHEPEA